jgi:hypothetical protein
MERGLRIFSLEKLTKPYAEETEETENITDNPVFSIRNVEVRFSETTLLRQVLFSVSDLSKCQ